MNTEKVKVDHLYYEKKVYELGALIRAGELVAFPTETVYGLGGNALDGKAAKRIYEAKGRPSDNPLIVHIASPQDVEKYVKSVGETERKLMNAFWPGPLTIIFPKADCIPKETSGGLGTIAVRCPSHPATVALIQAAGVPIAGPSANTSGKPSPTNADSVLSDMNGRIAAVIDGGSSALGLESTVVAEEEGVIVIYRPGCITAEMLETVGVTRWDGGLKDESSVPKAPGMKYRHYAPQAPLTVYVGDKAATDAQILSFANRKGFGFFVSEETAELLPPGVPLFIWGKRSDQNSFARRLFEGLRYFDEQPIDQIIGEGTCEDGLGATIMNRLEKASGHHVVKL